MGIKQCNVAALPDFPNVIRPNESNPDSVTSHFMGVYKKVYPWSYRRLFSHVSEWEKVFLGPI